MQDLRSTRIVAMQKLQPFGEKHAPPPQRINCSLAARNFSRRVAPIGEIIWRGLATIGFVFVSGCTTDRSPTETPGEAIQVSMFLSRPVIAESISQPGVSLSLKGGASSTVVEESFTIDFDGTIHSDVQADIACLNLNCGSNTFVPGFVPLGPSYSHDSFALKVDRAFGNPAAVRAAITNYLSRVPKKAVRSPRVFSEPINLLVAQDLRVGGQSFRLAIFVDGYGRRIRTRFSTADGIPIVQLSHSWTANDDLQAVGYYQFKEDGTPGSGFEASAEGGFPLRFTHAENTDPIGVLASACGALGRFFEKVALPTAAFAQVGGSNCWYEKAKLGGLLAFTVAGAYAGGSLAPAGIAVCTSSGMAATACVSAFGLASIGVMNQVDEFTRCVQDDLKANAGQYAAYYSSSAGSAWVHTFLGMGPSDASIQTFFNTFGPSTSLIGIMRNENTSANIGFVTAGGLTMVTVVHSEEGGTGSATIEKMIQIGKK